MQSDKNDSISLQNMNVELSRFQLGELSEVLPYMPLSLIHIWSYLIGSHVTKVNDFFEFLCSFAFLSNDPQ